MRAHPSCCHERCADLLQQLVSLGVARLELRAEAADLRCLRAVQRRLLRGRGLFLPDARRGRVRLGDLSGVLGALEKSGIGASVRPEDNVLTRALCF